MEIKIKLRRKFSGQDGYGTYIEEIGVSVQAGIVYRSSDGGNLEIGELLEWEKEEKAFEFLLGFQPSTELAELLKNEISLLPDLQEYNDEEWNDVGDYVEEEGEINYGKY